MLWQHFLINTTNSANPHYGRVLHFNIFFFNRTKNITLKIRTSIVKLDNNIIFSYDVLLVLSVGSHEKVGITDSVICKFVT